MYRQRPSSVRHSVAWVSSATAEAEDHRVLPDGCLDLLWHRGELLVAGPDTVAHVATWTPGATYAGLRFGAGVGPRVIGVPAHALRNRRIPLADLWPAADARRVTEQLAASHRPTRALESIAVDRLRGTNPPDPVASFLVRRLSSGDRVGALAHDVGLSARQLHRRSLDALGYGPKTFARIMRMNRALDLCRVGHPAAEAAWRAGYADQAHFARDVRALAGVTLTTLLA